MLELKRRNLVELPFEVLEQAHWRAREVQLCCKYKTAESDEKEYIRLRRHWRQKEVFFNFSLDALLMALNPTELANVAKAISSLHFKSSFFFSGYCQQLKSIIGVPDFIVSDEYSCVLGEIKIVGKRLYDFDQYIKYQSFAALCRAISHLPKELIHIVVVPDTEPIRFISDYGKNWIPEVKQGELELSQNEKEFVVKKLKENLVEIANKLKERSLGKDTCELIPTLILSWNDFIEKFDVAAQRTDLKFASQTLLDLSMGKVTIELNC